METSNAIKSQSDWLLDAIATATQNRMFLRGDPQCDAVACEAIISNASKAMSQLLSAELERIRVALGGYKDSDLASLSETLRNRNAALEAESSRLIAAMVLIDTARAQAAAEIEEVHRYLDGCFVNSPDEGRAVPLIDRVVLLVSQIASGDAARLRAGQSWPDFLAQLIEE